MEALTYGKAIAACLNETLQRQIDLAEDTDLVGLGLDSINFVRLIVLLEERFSIRIADQDVLLANFGTPRRIDRLLARYLQPEQ
ncbi:MAG: acyl carrier protein [Brevibacillus sp.]|nr:acyl carrier protein [Brevibacillus sp.]